MVGDGPDKKKAKDFLRKNNLKNKVIFLGKTSEVDEILCSSDLFLLPSEKESFGLAALEAMAVGVPVISSDTGGIPEVNIQGYSGFLSPVGDIEGMANNTLKLLDPVQKQQFRNQALEQAKAFSIERVVPQYEEIYLNLVSKK